MQQQVLMSMPSQMQQHQLGAQMLMVALQPNASLNSSNTVIHPGAAAYEAPRLVRGTSVHDEYECGRGETR